MIIDKKPEPLECLHLPALERAVLRGVGGCLSPSAADLKTSWSSCSAGLGGVDKTVGETVAGTMGGVVSKATSDTIELASE